MPLPRGIIGNRYWNANGQGVAVVACHEQGEPDWAAYIGAQPDPVSENEACAWVRRFGCKLEHHEAAVLLPAVADQMQAAAITYRR